VTPIDPGTGFRAHFPLPFAYLSLANGGETKEQLEQVRALGCTEMQGYLFSKARTAADLAELLAAQEPVTRRRSRRRAA
jgi:predicted signal transduction protein with EAL and GGDEF domain